MEGKQVTALPVQEGSGPSMEALSGMITQAVQQAMSGMSLSSVPLQSVYDRNERPLGSVVISGTGLGLSLIGAGYTLWSSAGESGEQSQAAA